MVLLKLFFPCSRDICVCLFETPDLPAPNICFWNSTWDLDMGECSCWGGDENDMGALPALAPGSPTRASAGVGVGGGEKAGPEKDWSLCCKNMIFGHAVDGRIPFAPRWNHGKPLFIVICRGMIDSKVQSRVPIQVFIGPNKAKPQARCFGNLNHHLSTFSKGLQEKGPCRWSDTRSSSFLKVLWISDTKFARGQRHDGVTKGFVKLGGRGVARYPKSPV